MTTQDLFEPQGFYKEFKVAWKPQEGDQDGWGDLTPHPKEDDYGPNLTKTIEQAMIRLARRHDLYCQNIEQKIRKESVEQEWMNVDHVIIGGDRTYRRFPLIAVEHETGFIASKLGRLVDGKQTTASFEWALWKVLTMRARLSVFIAYPEESQRDLAKWVVGEIAGGWCETYASLGWKPNTLLLMGWKNQKDSASDLYEPFRIDDKGRMVELDR